MALKTSLREKIALVLCGVFLTLILIEMGLRLAGFVFLSVQEYKNLAVLRHHGTYRILCLGESTTAGQYPWFLQELLNKSGTGMRFSVIDKGIVSANSAIILNSVESYLAEYRPNMVIAMMGINDVRIQYYAGIPDEETVLFKQCRTYKLVRIIWKNIAEQMGVQRQAHNQGNRPAVEDDRAYLALGRAYKREGRLGEAETALKKAAEFNPHNDLAYMELGKLYRNQGEWSRADDSFKQATTLNPRNDRAFLEWGLFYRGHRDLLRAEAAFKQAVALNPGNEWAWVELGWLYHDQGNLVQAEETCKKALELCPEGARFRRMMSLIREEEKNGVYAGPHRENEGGRENSYYAAATFSNYRRLKEILDKRKIRLVCVQYPLWSVGPLKDIFWDRPEVIFVNNETSFKEAVQKEGYRAYFADMFAGDFGHCTEKGNRLLAENIADVILKEIFNK